MKTYAIGISVYSDELFPEDYQDGEENIYEMNEEEYKEFNKIKFQSPYDMDEWFMNNLDPKNIYIVQEFVDGLCELDNIIFDYEKQEYL